MNYVAMARSNYFRVKDPDAFLDFCQAHELRPLLHEDELHVGFVSETDDGGFPSGEWDEEEGEDVDFDIEAELAPHLQDGEVAILIEVGYQGNRWCYGHASAVNNKGETRQIDLNLAIETMAHELTDNKDLMLPEY